MLLRLLKLSLHTVAWAVTLAIPLLAIWVGSSLASFHFGMPEFAAGAGLLLFPVLPLAWDLWGERKRRRKGDDRPRILTRGDRVLVRTVALNTLFVGVVFGLAPAQVFEATAARGDWFLDGAEGEYVPHVRDGVHRAAQGLEWLYELAVDNPYEDMADDGVDEGADGVDPDSLPDDPGFTFDETQPDGDPDDGAGPAANDGTLDAGENALWPMEPVLHPAASTVPAAALESVEGVAAYLQARTSGEADLAKAIHDFVAVHVDYDAPALADGRYPPQDAVTVLREGIGVCAGYANLFAAIGKAAGLETIYVVGDSRSVTDGQVADVGHAWNAVKVDGVWHLVDVTWNSGTVDGRVFTERYSTTYLFTPPAVFAETHFPDDPRWQLQREPIDRVTFARQVMASPEFHARGLRFEQPTRWANDVHDTLTVRIANPGRESLWMHVGRDGDGEMTACGEPSDAPVVQVTCRIPQRGVWLVSTGMEDEPRQYRRVATLRAVR